MANDHAMGSQRAFKEVMERTQEDNVDAVIATMDILLCIVIVT